MKGNGWTSPTMSAALVLVSAVWLVTAPAARAAPVTYVFEPGSNVTFAADTETMAGWITYDTTTNLVSGVDITLAGALPYSGTYGPEFASPYLSAPDEILAFETGPDPTDPSNPTGGASLNLFFFNGLYGSPTAVSTVGFQSEVPGHGNVTVPDSSVSASVTPVSPTSPILPTGPCPTYLRFIKIIACYGFSSDPSGAWYDPATASGYAYQMTNGSLFTEILDLPTGFLEPFDVTSPGCSIPGTFEGGQSVNFVALCGQGVSAFTITGIDPMFDPTDPAAFPIELAFNTATADFDAGALASTASTIPEPSSVLLLSAGMIGLGLINRKRVY